MCAKSCSSRIRFKSDILMVPVLPVSNAMKASRTCALVASKLHNGKVEVVLKRLSHLVKLHVSIGVSMIRVFPKIGVGPPNFNRVFHEINHPFWGKTALFLG